MSDLKSLIQIITNEPQTSQSGIFNLLTNERLNKFINVGYEWKEIALSNDSFIYNIPRYSDYIPTFQIVNSTDNSVTIKLMAGNILIGTYELNEEINNIIPVYGTPGLMNSGIQQSFRFESPVSIKINAMYAFCNKSNPNYVGNIRKTDFKFIGPQGDVFEAAGGKELGIHILTKIESVE
jgi:hypothetical protein